MNPRSEDIINSNLEYASGLYDLYQSDEDVKNALYLKGFNEQIVEQILFRIKDAAYQKRLLQAKKHILYGFGLFVILFIVKTLLGMLPVTGEMNSGRDGAESMLGWVFKFYREVFYFLMALCLVRGIGGSLTWLALKKKGTLLSLNEK